MSRFLDHLFWILPVVVVFGIMGAFVWALAVRPMPPCRPYVCKPTWSSDCYCHHQEHRIEWHGDAVLCRCGVPKPEGT